MIQVENLTKRYAGFTALDRVSFEVAEGTVVGFLGANGAGKTTTLRILSCFMPPSEGCARVGGFDTVRQGHEVRRIIGYLPESVPLYGDMRVDEYLRFRARLKGVTAAAAQAAIDRVVSRCKLTEKRRNLIKALSKGQRQRVGIADALVHDPRLLILDEPTSGLDPDQRLEVRHLIAELGADRTVLLSTHILPEAEASCSHVVIIHRGHVVASAATTALANAEGHWMLVHSGAPLSNAPENHYDVVTDRSSIRCTTQLDAAAMASVAVVAGRQVLELSCHRRTLESIFMDVVGGRSDLA